MLETILLEMQGELSERFDLEVDVVENTLCIKEFNNYVDSSDTYDSVEELAERAIEWIRYNYDSLDADYSILGNCDYDLIIEII